MNIVIAGGGYAGLMTALRLAGRTKAADITLVDAKDHFAQRIRNHQAAAGGTIRAIPYAKLFRGTRIQFIQGQIESLDAGARRLHVRTGLITRDLPYDLLVNALGSYTDVESTPGVKAHALTLDGRHTRPLRQALMQADQQAGHVLIVGGGLTGIETVTELAQAYPRARLHLVTAGALGGALSAAGQAYLGRVFSRHNIRLTQGRRVVQLDSDAALLDDGSRVPFDVCVWAGAFMASPLAREAGLSVNARGQMLVDETLRSVSHPAIIGVGDNAQFIGSSPERAHIRMACATAMPMGAHAADVIASLLNGTQPAPFGFGYMLRCISLGRGDALVQFVDADDSPAQRILTGRRGAWVKELICRFTVWALWAERRIPGLYTWKGRLTGTTHSVEAAHGPHRRSI